METADFIQQIKFKLTSSLQRIRSDFENKTRKLYLKPELFYNIHGLQVFVNLKVELNANWK